MSDDPQEVVMFRSADSSAEEDADEVLELLVAGGLQARLLTDGDPGVPSGAVEVRVPAGMEARAEQILKSAECSDFPPADASHTFDLDVVFEGVGTTAEMEAIGLRSVLDAYGIPSVLVGTPQVPTLPFLLKVPRVHLEQARQAIAEARKAVPEAAEEAERASEATL